MAYKEKSNRIPNRELVVYALYLLGGHSKRVHTEDISLKCFELFPHSFSWAKYKEYPDKDIVRVALTDAHKERFGPLVQGRSGQRAGLAKKTSRPPVEDGWILTPKGIDWIRTNLTKFEKADLHIKDHRQQLLRKLRIIREHPLFSRYIDNPHGFKPMLGEIADMLRCRVDAEEEVWIERFKKAELMARSANQADVSKLIKICQEAYFKQR